MARQFDFCCLGECVYDGFVTLNRLAICTVSYIWIGFVGCVCVAPVENRIAFKRLSALRANRIFNRSLLSAFFIYGSSFSMVFLLSLYLQYIYELSPSEAGKIVLIQTLIMMVLAPITGRLSDRFEPRVLSTFGCLLFVIGYAMLFRLDMHTSLNYVMLVFLGLGSGFFSSPNNNAAIGSVPADKLSIAAAILNLARTMGNMVSSAVVMTLFSVTMGGAAITSELYPQLLLVIKITMGLSVCYALIAATFSYRRGTIH